MYLSSDEDLCLLELGTEMCTPIVVASEGTRQAGIACMMQHLGFQRGLGLTTGIQTPFEALQSEEMAGGSN